MDLESIIKQEGLSKGPHGNDIYKRIKRPAPRPIRALEEVKIDSSSSVIDLS